MTTTGFRSRGRSGPARLLHRAGVGPPIRQVEPLDRRSAAQAVLAAIHVQPLPFRQPADGDRSSHPGRPSQAGRRDDRTAATKRSGDASLRSGSGPRRSRTRPTDSSSRNSHAVGPDRSHVEVAPPRRSRPAVPDPVSGVDIRRKRPNSPRCTCSAPPENRACGEVALTAPPARSRRRSRASRWMVWPSGIVAFQSMGPPNTHPPADPAGRLDLG